MSSSSESADSDTPLPNCKYSQKSMIALINMDKTMSTRSGPKMMWTGAKKRRRWDRVQLCLSRPSMKEVRLLLEKRQRLSEQGCEGELADALKGAPTVDEAEKQHPETEGQTVDEAEKQHEEGGGETPTRTSVRK